ncbi:fibronectin type III-like domain-contianing protein, partial [Actinomycetota bacterium]
PSSVGQVPNHASRTASDDRDYVFSSSEPLFAFGHGLTYTTFTYGPPRVEPPVIPPDGMATVQVTVTNSGDRFGEEVVQLYVSDLLASVARPRQALCGFRRVALEAGESQVVRFEVRTEHLEVIGQNMERVVEPGTFAVGVGGSPHATQQAILTVE